MFQLSKYTFPPLSALIPSWLTDNPIYHNPDVRTLLFGIGAGFCLFQACSLLKNLLSMLSPPKNLAKRYGKASWAVITGASDGIGKAYAYELARRGFNIVLLARSRQKLEKVAADLTLKYPSTQIKIVVEDFINAAEEGFAERIYSQVKDLDISILINNAGSFYSNYYAKLSLLEIKKMILTNCLSHALITRILLPQLSSREQRSAIITTSSVAAAVPMPYAQAYASSKSFLHFLSEGLAYEHPNIDFLSLKPGAVKTKMGKKVNALEIEMVTPEKLVKKALNTVGTKSSTYGVIKHKLYGWGSEISPGFLVKANAKRNFLK